MESDTQVLRINIEGRWEADEFSRSLLLLTMAP